jgi:ribosome maturation factor RimP
MEPLLTRLDYELVELEYHPARGSARVVLYIDRPDGVGLDDCERVSREVSALLDVEDPIPLRYTLEVSSPGFDRILRTPEHFRRFVGARVHVELSVSHDGRKRYTGALLEAGERGIVMEVDRNRVEVAYGEIARARLAS